MKANNASVRKVLQSDSEEDEEVVFQDESDNDAINLFEKENGKENNKDIFTEVCLQKPLSRPPCVGDYVIGKFSTKNTKINYVLHNPNVPDISYVRDYDIKFIT